MAMVPWYGLYSYGGYTEELQIEAISEVLTLPVAMKQSRLGTYGLPLSCRILVRAVLLGMNDVLLSWSNDAGVGITNTQMPCYRPEAFRLECGCSIWPAPGHVAILVPLTRVAASIEMVPRGTNYILPTAWDPGMVIFLNEMGMRFTGNGSVRFIYILLHKE